MRARHLHDAYRDGIARFLEESDERKAINRTLRELEATDDEAPNWPLIREIEEADAEDDRRLIDHANEMVQLVYKEHGKHTGRDLRVLIRSLIERTNDPKLIELFSRRANG